MEFRGEYYFLSNFYPCDVYYKGLLFKCSEAAYQSGKVASITTRIEFTFMDGTTSKHKGRTCLLKSTWSNRLSEEIMYKVNLSKFTRNPELKQMLSNTGSIELVEDNTWNDTNWGKCNGRGKNKLGKILMRIRDELN